MYSAAEVQRAFVKSLLVDRTALTEYQEANDPMMAQATLKQAYNLDVEVILQMARLQEGGAISPVACYRASQYRQACTKSRPADPNKTGSGIV
jgi:L-rhamnose isomerase/sugar isomerase